MHHLAFELAAALGFLWRELINFKTGKHFPCFGVKLSEVYRFDKDLMTKSPLASEIKENNAYSRINLSWAAHVLGLQNDIFTEYFSYLYVKIR